MTSDQKYKDPVDFFIGGAGDFKTKLVKRYQEAFEARHKTRSVFYFEHTQFGQAQSTLDALPCLLYTSPSPRDRTRSRMPSSA